MQAKKGRQNTGKGKTKSSLATSKAAKQTKNTAIATPNISANAALKGVNRSNNSRGNSIVGHVASKEVNCKNKRVKERTTPTNYKPESAMEAKL